jgi:hypothetical protein
MVQLTSRDAMGDAGMQRLQAAARECERLAEEVARGRSQVWRERLRNPATMETTTETTTKYDDEENHGDDDENHIDDNESHIDDDENHVGDTETDRDDECR